MHISKTKFYSVFRWNLLLNLRNNIKTIVEYGEKLRKSQNLKDPIDEILLRFLSPAPQNYVYLTYYKNKMFLSCVPELILERVDMYGIDEENECEMYSLKINQNAKYTEDILLRQESPLIRPSIKTKQITREDANVKKLRESIVSILERD